MLIAKPFSVPAARRKGVVVACSCSNNAKSQQDARRITWRRFIEHAEAVDMRRKKAEMARTEAMESVRVTLDDLVRRELESIKSIASELYSAHHQGTSADKPQDDDSGPLTLDSINDDTVVTTRPDDVFVNRKSL